MKIPHQLQKTGRRVGAAARFLFGAIVDFIYPPLCLMCDSYLAADEQLVHPQCLAKLPLLDDELLDGIALEQALHFAPSFESSIALYAYSDELQKLIHLFKYGGLWSLAEPLGKNLGQMLIDLNYASQMDALVPVPLHQSRQRQRGYNQAEKLAQVVGKICNIPVWTDVLRRQRPTPQQAKLNREQRMRNLLGAFTALNPQKIEQKCLAIIDDVLTTGATMEECARTLLDAGATRILAVSLARVV